MRVNVYAEEMTDRIEIISKEIDGQRFTGLRLYLELPATLPDGTNYAAPFMHRPGDDDSAAVTFWGKRDLRTVLRKALAMLDAHYGDAPAPAAAAAAGLAPKEHGATAIGSERRLAADIGRVIIGAEAKITGRPPRISGDAAAPAAGNSLKTGGE